nr:immunoglobulin heavy chain junction region [Macaca mulatta]MOX59700.1 immunoglobulin heavy chain junction region [Macaca mulatta]MOX59805.1 immunoglobulin heavy chain junction region [Macaca mulatta]MOX60284.1 immunoglobulin heavy chain junction region [Macaca mulatta]MOX60761.1 immunoglobulin heavy chain junction region [Macaca mulatta]
CAKQYSGSYYYSHFDFW